MEGLKPCPFCGGDNINVGTNYEYPAWWEVFCHDCQYGGPSADSREKAVEMWNGRADKSREVLGRVLEYLSVKEVAVPVALLTEMLEVIWEVRPLDG